MSKKKSNTLLFFAESLAMITFEHVRRLLNGDLKSAMKIHASICIIIGTGTLLLPHRFYFFAVGGSYNHFAHEFVRLYGCLTLGIGYIVWSTRSIKDGRLQRSFSEAFALCYGLQALCILRAQFASPDGHSILHWFIGLLFVGISGVYAMIRFTRKIKEFELPDSIHEQ